MDWDYKSNHISYIRTNLTEREKLINSLTHFWTIAVSESKFVIFLAGYQKFAMNSAAELINWQSRKSIANNLIGTNIEELIKKEDIKIKYVFHIDKDKPVRFKILKNWSGIGKKLLIEADTKQLGYDPKIVISKGIMKDLEEAIPNIEFEYIKK